MLQPRQYVQAICILLYFLDFVQGFNNLNTSPRKRRDNAKDITTVLLVDNHGKNSLGRFLNVKPNLGLITSTARTFIQDGVTTEYATQVLGTTLDNGRLYAHLLTKSSRVLYDSDRQTKSYDQQQQPNPWQLGENQIINKNIIRNTDFISPDHSQAVHVFPTSLPFNSPSILQSINDNNAEQEILNEAQSKNARQPYNNNDNNERKHVVRPENILVYKFNTKNDQHPTHENLILHNDNPTHLNVKPSKVKGWENLPTFTVRNEFSPSGFSYLDFPEFDTKTEKSRITTQSDRKAKLLFKAGLLKPNPIDFETVTYSGFADFTTTVANTVIVFTPHTSEAAISTAQVTKIAVEPTIKPTSVQSLPFATQDPTTPSEEEQEEDNDDNEDENSQSTQQETTKEQTSSNYFTTEELPTTKALSDSDKVYGKIFNSNFGLNKVIINKEDRDGKKKSTEEPINLAAKMSVLANEQKQDGVQPSSHEDGVIQFTDEVIQPSESQPVMLSTPSADDIAKILASIQAQAKVATQPLSSVATTFIDTEEESEDVVLKTSSGATTIFFEDDFSFEPTTSVQTENNLPSVAIIQEKITTTTEEQSETSSDETTSVKITTTKQENDDDEILEKLVTTTQESPTTPELAENEIETDKSNENIEPTCTAGSKIVPNSVFKTLTYLTTFYIPVEETTSVSVKSNVVVSTEINSETIPCNVNEIEATSTSQTTEATVQVPTTEQIETTTEQKPLTTIENSEAIPTTTLSSEDDRDETTTLPETTTTTTLQEVTTESKHVITESEPETTEATTEEGDELELIFKTLYTTYTYLTTYFQDSTSSVASRIVVTTNVITSTVDPANEATDPAIAGLLNDDDDDEEGTVYKSKTVTFDDLAGIQPSASIQNDFVSSTQKHSKENDGNNDNDDEDSDVNKEEATPALDDKYLQTVNNIKTFYTTYTYFTTIFVDGETEISSRTEVFTNFVTPSATNGNGDDEILPTKLLDDQLSIQNRLKTLQYNGTNYSSITRQKSINLENNITDNDDDDDDDNNLIPARTHSTDGYVTLSRGEKKKETENDILDLTDYENYEKISTMVTDVRSSTSKGDQRIIENVDKRNILLEDQVVSESNNDSEIIPSPTLLLQTSYTTFTYFTTMYHGTASDIVSRLETVTNVVTTTLTPTPTIVPEETSLPVTYFTTFTYWTTFYKDGQTKITSREQTVSNVVTPDFKSTEAPEQIVPTLTSIENLEPTALATSRIDVPSTSQVESPEKILVPSTVGGDDLTTFFTTYTYYTTSYIGDETILNSRLETFTNVLNATDSKDQVINSQPTEVRLDDKNATVIEPTGLSSSAIETLKNESTTVSSTDTIQTNDTLESITSTSTLEQNLKPTGVISINQGRIVDADDVSTLLYTTEAIGTYVDNVYGEVTKSTSSLVVDQDKKSALATDVPTAHRTGLVRRIEGSIIQNRTTTLYESKVLGTIIDGRYAQIIQSTSSFILPTTATASLKENLLTPTKILDNQSGSSALSPTPVVLESSLGDSTSKIEEATTKDTNEDEEEEGNDNKNKFNQSSKKRTFTQSIRPFGHRPPFAPKRSKVGATTAATITRSDFTPTVTAVPASRQNRFGAKRSSTSANQVIQPTASGRRFSRPKSTSALSRRRSSTSQIKPTATGFRKAASSTKTSAGLGIRSSSLFSANSRPRIRPTALGGLSRSPSSKILTETPAENDDNNVANNDNNTDTSDDVNDTTLPVQTTESARRNNNPLLRFNRPTFGRTNPRTTTARSTTSSASKGNKTPLTTTTPRTAYSRPNSLINRSRPGGLFPRRNLFTTTTTPAPEAETEEKEEQDDLVEEGEENDDGEDTDFESSLLNTQTQEAPTTPTAKTNRPFNGVQIRPFRKRSKRQTTYSRFRRPQTTRTTTAASVSADLEQVDEPTSSKPSLFRNRYQANKYKSNKQQTTSAPATTTAAPTKRKRISPTKPSVGRTQFTLREKDSSSRTSNYKNRNSSIRRTTTNAPRGSSRGRNGHLTESSQINRKTTASSRNTGRGRNTNRNNRRGYQSNDQQVDDNLVTSKFDGTITVTYHVPTETSLPIINGKVTEYQNIITAKLSTEVLNPNQYSTSIGPLGKKIKILVSENTAVNNNGATLVTQFILNETPTTSVTFTPTTIGGRKTSFSHVVPSTVYQVEEVINTIQPALAAQAPLANILLSQLLLGGGAIPQNPLLALPNNPGIPATPTTEYKTRSSSRVTTVTNTVETVLPLTFRGKEILTTIFDTSSEVITAIDYFTDTIVITPTLPVFGQAPQLNTLIFPLLQQQLQQQQQQQANQLLQQQALMPQTPANVFNLNDAQNHAIIEETNQNLDLDESEPNENDAIDISSRKINRNRKGLAPVQVKPPQKQTSIVTLYVSGRTPDDFTTVLSTVTVDEETRKRRDAIYVVPVKPSIMLENIDGTIELFDEYIQPATKDVNIDSSESNIKETESLESIVGDLSKYLDTKTFAPEVKQPKSTKKYTIKYVKALKDLSKISAPDYAKVETFTMKPGDILSDQMKIINFNKEFYVSKQIGKINDENSVNNFYLNNVNSSSVRIRKKRDLKNDTNESISKKRKVIKRLIRKQPVASNLNANNNINRANSRTGRKRRRKVKIKKKRILFPKNGFVATNTNYINGLEEQGQQATKPRRKIIITRKRILPKNSQTVMNHVMEVSSSPQLLAEHFNSQINNKHLKTVDAYGQSTDEDIYLKKLNNKEENAFNSDGNTEKNLIDDDLTEEDINEGNEDNEEIDDEEIVDDDDNDEREYEEDNEDEYIDDDDISEGDNEDIENENTDSVLPDITEIDAQNTPDASVQIVPDHEPSFPDSLHSPSLLLKTTILSNTEYLTKTLTISELHTHTVWLTHSADSKEIIIPTLEIRPEIKLTTVTESSTSYTTLTLLDLDNMDKVTDTLQPTISLSTLENNPPSLLLSISNDKAESTVEEARNLATRIMSNGVEVIVAGDKLTYPGDQFKRILTNSQKPFTLKPSTLSDHMMLMLPQQTSIIDNSAVPLDPNQFVVKTCLTTFTYLTTYLEKGSTTVSSHEQVISNVATEERLNTGKILPTPAVGVTLTQHPNLSVGIFHTTYTYLNTILDGEQPLVFSSQHIVANTITAPDDYLSLLKPQEYTTAVKNTNTYFTTIDLEKTLDENGSKSVISTKEVVTQVIITESVPPRDRPVMTSYIALDRTSDTMSSKIVTSTTDVTKTYFVTYTYFNTVTNNGVPTVFTNISTESDVVTEKLVLQPKKTTSSIASNTYAKPSADILEDNHFKFDILATKVYYTTFTYLTTLLKEKDPLESTIINSSTKIEQNIVTETLAPNMFDQQYLSSLNEDLKRNSGSIERLATLSDGQLVEIIVKANDKHNEIKPSQVNHIEKTRMPEFVDNTESSEALSSTLLLEGSFSTSKPNIITGSTIVFIDDDPFANLAPTPELSSTKSSSVIKQTGNTVNANHLGSLLASEVVKETKIDVVTSKVRRPAHRSKNKNKNKINPTKSVSTVTTTTNSVKKNEKNDTKKQNQPAKTPNAKQPAPVAAAPAAPASDLLGLGSINIPNTLEVLTPVLNAMAGYINKNLKSTRRNDVNNTKVPSKNSTDKKAPDVQKVINQQDTHGSVDVQNRSPVYIPVGGALGEDFEIAESQNIATFDWNDPVKPETLNKLKHEAPLLSEGIPISPGDIITANSDVIVGKPGRVGPRLPSAIPLHHENPNEIPLGMKPPPIPDKGTSNNHLNQRPQIPLVQQANIIHAPNKDDYIGPPPPPKQKIDKIRGDKRKQIPLSHSTFAAVPHPNEHKGQLKNRYNIKTNQQIVAESQTVQTVSNAATDNFPSNQNKNNEILVYAPHYKGEKPPSYTSNQNVIPYETSGEVFQQNLQEVIHKNYNLESQKPGGYPPEYASNQDPIIIPSIPLVHPEIVERSTGLLVKLQPSQVAIVNIPFNRTTALIYGGSTEIHHNGQYFDDPSPYPDPEFSSNDNPKDNVAQPSTINKSTPQLQSLNQKQVSGVIKVGVSNNQINTQYDLNAQFNQNHVISFQPASILNGSHFVKDQTSDFNVPSLSFGLSNHNGEVNAHIIDHGNVNHQSSLQVDNLKGNENNQPPITFVSRNPFKIYQHQTEANIYVHNSNVISQNNEPIIGENLYNGIKTYQGSLNKGEQIQAAYDNQIGKESTQYPKEPSQDIVPPTYKPEMLSSLPSPQYISSKPTKAKYTSPPKRLFRPTRPRPINRIPQPVIPHIVVTSASTTDNRFVTKRPIGKSPIPIPLIPESQQINNPNTVSNSPSNVNEIFSVHSNTNILLGQMDGAINKYPHNDGSQIENTNTGTSADHHDDDLPNEDGEVVQESNQRPLQPGEVPTEVLNRTNTLIDDSNNLVRFPDRKPDSTMVRFPYDQNRYPVPQIILPEARPFEVSKHQISSNGNNAFRNQINNVKPPQFGIPLYNKSSNSGADHRTQTERNTLNIDQKPYSIQTSTTPATSPFDSFTKRTTHSIMLTNKLTEKPIIYYIDENGKSKESFFHPRPHKNNRPKVTSLPIDTQTARLPVVVPVVESNIHKENQHSQTEKAFDSKRYSSTISSNNIDIVTSIQDSTVSASTQKIYVNLTYSNSVSDEPLNHDEKYDFNVTDLTQEINNMGILQPPPLLAEVPSVPSVVMEPPKIDLNWTGSYETTVKMPVNQKGTTSTTKPTNKTYISHRDSVVAPQTEIVLGMSPPPLVTVVPIETDHNKFSMEVDIPLEERNNSTTMQQYEKVSKPKLSQYTRKPPGLRRTTTSVPFTSTTHKITTFSGNFKLKHTTPSAVSVAHNQRENETMLKKSGPTSTSTNITPTPTLKRKSSLDVIIGNPNMNVDVSKKVPQEHTQQNATSSNQNTSEKDNNEFTNKATPDLITIPQNFDYVITKPVHHAGNEIKIVDAGNKSAYNYTKESRSTILPTRYITHTKTHTVTITKTTVVKTLGGPPSTLTILVTKTEKSYIIDTVTEFHTLVKPTSITETVTTTVEKEIPFYSSRDVDSYSNIQPTASTKEVSIITATKDLHSSFNDDDDDEGNRESNANSNSSSKKNTYSNNSIIIVMSDESKDDSNDIAVHRDEITNNNGVDNIIKGGIFIPSQPEINHLPEENHDDKANECIPECKPSRNELCQNVEDVMKCVCRPGFARMFPDRPCNPTYTYNLNISLERIGKRQIKYNSKLADENSTQFINLANQAHEALDRMVMQSDLRDIYHGVHVTAFHPKKSSDGVISKFYLQLSDNIDEIRMEEIFKKYLRNNNYSLGGTEMFTSSESVENLRAQDFNECENSKLHDCSENSKCFNLKGTYTCSCKEGFSDLSENMLYPGRICSAEQVGCEKCNYHGTCYSKNSNEMICECFHWYTGQYCHINLKVLLIALVTLGLILFALLFICIVITCIRKKPNNAGGVTSTIGFLPPRMTTNTTLDRRAMIEDTSSEDSRSETNTLPPYVQQKPAKLKPAPAKGALKKSTRLSISEHSESAIIFPDQKDRSLTVMIPRAKYHHAPPTSTLMNYTSFDARKPSVPSINNEARLLSYLDAGPTPSKIETKRKSSNARSETYIEEKTNSRKTSGALVSAGFEVSATVVNNIGTLGTTCGTEADRSENATLIQKISADLMSRADTSSQFNTLRKSLVDDDLESNSNWMDLPRISTISEARSYDETTIPPPLKSFRSDYDLKSLQHHNDEAGTMAERDLGSTFLLPHTHLYKPDRGSDISGFESL